MPTFFFRKMHIYLSKLNFLAQFFNFMRFLLKEVNGFLILDVDALPPSANV